jgi:hypothetical protein
MLCRGALGHLRVLVKQNAAKVAPKADVRQRLDAPLDMHGLKGQHGGAQQILSLQGTCDAHPGFLGMGHGAARKGLPNRRHGSSRACRRIAPFANEGGR